MKPILIILFIATPIVLVAQKQVDIQLKNNTVYEEQTRDQLQKLMASYDLNRWIFTNKIIIESKVVPHSHPVLTLNTRHLKDDDLLLATFVHEQLHWFIDTHPAEAAVYAELKVMFPEPKVEFPEGSGNEEGTYYHILICHLEYSALKHLVGELKAFQVITFWQQDHYRWVYKTVLENQRKLDELVRKHAIMP